MKTAFLAAAILLAAFNTQAQIYKGNPDATTVSFFSASPLENIEATNKKATIVLNTATGDVQAGITMTYFKFAKPLMEEHFNENYVESAKYPTCVFKGKINEKVDWEKDGENKVTVSGKLDLHGVTKDAVLEGTITKKGTELVISTKFKITIADYKIKVPSLYVKNIAEVVDVTVNSTMLPFVKK